MVSLTEAGNHFFLYASGGSGPSLKNAGVDFVAGSSRWTPIGAEQTANGYEVAWKLTGTDQYTVWDTDSNGNHTSSPVNAVSGADYALQSLEPSFHQDLNGDGAIGIAVVSATVIQAAGSAKLVSGDLFHFREGILPNMADINTQSFLLSDAVQFSTEFAEKLLSGAQGHGTVDPSLNVVPVDFRFAEWHTSDFMIG